jgi:hypothetical protein
MIRPRSPGQTGAISANRRLQMVFPIGGDFSDAIVSEILKAAVNTNAARFAE